jgi:hypothetical protein
MDPRPGCVARTWPTVSPQNVLAALKEWRGKGRSEFLREHGRGSARYVIVVDEEDIDAKPILLAARKHAGLDTFGEFRGDRRTVLEPLRALGFEVDDLHASDDPAIDGPGTVPVEAELPAFAGDTDSLVLLRVRREQRHVRTRLGIRTGDPERLHTCGLCGELRPERLLVAAHIKSRALCTEEERRDFDAIAMPACLLGCDALFEHGYLTVGPDGMIQVDDRANAFAGTAVRLAGRAAPAWNPERAPHFRWHREHHHARA